jgi:hypothetical protein
MQQIDEKHYQLYKKLRFQYLFDNFNWAQWDLYIFAYQQDYSEDYYGTLERLFERYPASFESVNDLFGYTDNIARLFILRFNQELIYEFGNLDPIQAKNKMSKLI